MDGGYYAIKGFEYQFDKALLEVLSTEDDNSVVKVEQIQDISTCNFVMQVKYREATKLTPSTIRKPIIQLINEFELEPDKDYILYCYFSDTNGYTDEVDAELLDKILGHEKDNFPSSLKINFLAKFKLCFSPEFQSQYESILEHLKVLHFCNSKDEAHYYYSILVDYIRKKVINNSPNDLGLRQITRDELLAHLNNGRKIVFMPAYSDFIGQQAYFKLLKSRFRRPIKNQNTILRYGKVNIDDSCSLACLTFQIVDNHYTRATHDIKPLTFIIPDDTIDSVKKYFITHGCLFNDGYESIQFNQHLFELPAIINKKVTGGRATNSLSKTSFKARLIKESTFNQLTHFGLKGSWILIDSDISHLVDSSDIQMINQLTTQQIAKLF